MTKELLCRILASASGAMWETEPSLAAYTEDTAEHELDLAFHFAQYLRPWLPWLHCNCDLIKPAAGGRRPDIVFHLRGSHRANFLVVEAKRKGGAGWKADVKKITDYWQAPPYSYLFGACVVIDGGTRATSLHVLERGQGSDFKLHPATDFQVLPPPADEVRIGLCRQAAIRLVNLPDDVSQAELSESARALMDNIAALYTL